MSEFVAKVRQQVAENCTKMFGELDTDNDGKLSFDEFKASVNKDAQGDELAALQEEWASFELKDNLCD